MKKINLKNALLLLLIAFVFSIGLSGCIDIVVPPTTGYVQIKIMNDQYSYYVYMDGNEFTGTYLGVTSSTGIGTFDNILTGPHSFYVISTDYRYSGTINKTVYSGKNIIEIYTY